MECHTVLSLDFKIVTLTVNKAGYTATEVACAWAGAIFEVTGPFKQELWGQRNKIIKKRKV